MKKEKDIRKKIAQIETENKAMREGMKVFADNLELIDTVNTVIDQNAARIVELEWVLN